MPARGLEGLAASLGIDERAGDGLGRYPERRIATQGGNPVRSVLLTADKNLRYQQNLKGRRLAILVLPSNRLRVLRAMLGEIEAAMAQIIPGKPDQYLELLQPAE